MKKTNVAYMNALQEFNKVFVQSEDGLEAYNLDLMAHVALGTGRPQDLDASREHIGDQHAAIVLARTVKVGNRNIGELTPSVQIRRGATVGSVADAFVPGR